MLCDSAAESIREGTFLKPWSHAVCGFTDSICQPVNRVFALTLTVDAHPCEGRPVVLVSGGNSAGQAAMFLCARANHVHILIRGAQLSSTMSDYLAQRILASTAITLHSCSEVVSLEGTTHLSHVTWQSRATGEKTRVETEHLFVMIGADPCTTWLRDCVDLNANGFVRTSSGSEDRGPFETSVRGIFAVGDVRTISTTCFSTTPTASGLNQKLWSSKGPRTVS